MTLTVHHLIHSRSDKILWLLEELNVPYTIKAYPRTAEGLAPPELKKVHPIGKSPVITDDGLTLAESAAIVEYILTKYGNGRFRPTEAGWIDNLYFSNYAESTLSPLVVQKIVFSVVPSKVPFLIRPIAKGISAGVTKDLIAPQLVVNADIVEKAFAKSSTGWIAGGPEPTAADFLLLYPLEFLESDVLNVLGPKAKAFLKQVKARPAYQKAIANVAKYEPKK